jgi:hypothetical protein
MFLNVSGNQRVSFFLGMGAMDLGGAGGSDGPLKADGTPDMRYSANQ